MVKLMKIGKKFYQRDTLTVARELIGCILVHNDVEGTTSGKIVETEAYMGPEDKGAHSYLGKHTPLMDPLFKKGGHAYIFPIYGVGYCFNVVTEAENFPRAVLIRAIEPVQGWNLMKKRRNILTEIPAKNMKNLTNGPVKLCKAMNVDKSLNGIDLCGDELFITERVDQKIDEKILTSQRINIDYAGNDKYKPWRFILDGNDFLSKN